MRKSIVPPAQVRDTVDLFKLPGQRNISLRGEGTLDGCGGSWWHAPLPMGENRGRLIALVRCDDIAIEDVTLRNSVRH